MRLVLLSRRLRLDRLCSAKPDPDHPLHQRQLAGFVSAIASGQTDIRDILTAVTPGGGKSLLTVLAAAQLMRAGLIDRVCWVVPRDSLRLQAEEAFADPAWRATLGHALAVRAADNTPNPSRGLAGYITTYQGVAAAPDLHLAEFHRHRTLLVVDEVHHLPALADTEPVTARQSPDTEDDPASAWSRALLPLFKCAAYRLLLSDTLERADGKGILWLPYRKGPKVRTREVELDAPGWAVVGYSRRQALAEKALLPVTFGALDGEASWRDEEGRDVGPHRLAAGHPEETTRPALITALRTGFADALLREAFLAIRGMRAERRLQHGLAADASARGLGKLLFVAPDQGTARRYHALIQGWLPVAETPVAAQLATSDTPQAHETLAAFRLTPEPSVDAGVKLVLPQVPCCRAYTLRADRRETWTHVHGVRSVPTTLLSFVPRSLKVTRVLATSEHVTIEAVPRPTSAVARCAARPRDGSIAGIDACCTIFPGKAGQ